MSKAVFAGRPEGASSIRFLNWFCPGCNRAHSVPIDGPQGWTFSGDLDNPTLSPSVGVHYESLSFFTCHSFVEHGRIRFLADCRHALAGQTIDMPDFRAALAARDAGEEEQAK